MAHSGETGPNGPHSRSKNITEEIGGPSTRKRGKEGWGDAPLGSACPVCMEPQVQATAPYKVGVAGHGSVPLYTWHSTNLFSQLKSFLTATQSIFESVSSPGPLHLAFLLESLPKFCSWTTSMQTHVFGCICIKPNDTAKLQGSAVSFQSLS